MAPFDDRAVAREALRDAGFGSGVIPVAWDEIAALGLGRSSARTGRGRHDHRDQGRFPRRRPRRPLRRPEHGVDYVRGGGAGRGTLVPDDQEAALAALASLVRAKSDARVVAVVGSDRQDVDQGHPRGALQRRRADDLGRGEPNNEIGLPLTVCRLEPETEVLVTEMGMRGLGQIAALCEIARPDVVLVTSIGPEHLELVGTVEQWPRRTPRRSRRSAGRDRRRAGATPPSWRRSRARRHRDPCGSTGPRSTASGHDWRFPLPVGDLA